MPNKPLPDADARIAIANEVDTNLVVEAAAGTGKTTSLVARLMTLFRRGALSGESRLAAVTFTHKAAAELRERLERELRSAIARGGELSPEERANLAAAARALPECHIGTIHSFCGRLLRERPVEAGVGLEFDEIDQDEDLLIRREAWNEFADQLRRGQWRGLNTVFELFGLDHEALGKGFEKYAEYPDVDVWPGAARTMADIDVAAFVRGIEKFHASLERFKPALHNAVAGNDQLLPLMQLLDRRWQRIAKPLSLADAHRLSRLFRENPGLVQGQWEQLGLKKAEAKEELAAYAEFHRAAVRPFRRDGLAAVYAAALEAYGEARRIYDRMRREQGVLNFQDLLMTAARLLRDFPDVRADLASRYARLLVDEVQDTDPVQAEIMFLLASADMKERDWRRCHPRAGSLFIVGDPKQSIYRFRRADIVVYQEVKRLIEEGGGRVLGLVANFRSQPSVIEWVNRTFLLPEDGGEASPEAVALSGKFSKDDSDYGPAYMALQPGLETGREGFHGVYALETISFSRKKKIGDRDIILDEAARIAAFIRHAVDAGLPIPGRNGARPARPGDFMIVTYQKGQAVHYADAARRLGLPCQVSSGSTLSDSPALKLLLQYVQALSRPDDPVLLAGVLRGGLFGVDDRRLFRWKQAGGAFDVLSPLPENGEAELTEIFTLLLKHHRLFRSIEPVLAAERVTGELGLWAYACTGEDAAGGAGALAAALERLAAVRRDIATPGKLAERLEWIMANHEEDPLPADPPPEPPVRIMNLHKTKGLEAPVVFLTSTRTVRKHKPTFSVRRGDGVTTGALALSGGQYNETQLAQPVEWEEMAEREELFLAAEKTRLNYVAATRAGAALVVSVHKSGKGWNSAFLPEFVPGVTIPDKLPEPETPAAPPVAAAENEKTESIAADALAALTSERERGREIMLRETYQTKRGKAESDWGVAAGPEDDASAVMELGEVLHRLMESPLGDGALPETAERLLREYQLPTESAAGLASMAAAARRSAIWRRAKRAERVFREAPYSLRVREGGETTLQRGVIDLVFREKDGWVIVDYKSGGTRGSGARADAERHAAQLAAYARAWQAITGEKVIETGIYFLRSGEYVLVAATAET